MAKILIADDDLQVRQMLEETLEELEAYGVELIITGNGMEALEAMACGTPVVTVDHPRNAVRERINATTGRIANLTSEDLGGKILDCLRDPSRFRPGCTALAAAYDWEVILPQLERYYQKVAG